MKKQVIKAWALFYDDLFIQAGLKPRELHFPRPVQTTEKIVPCEIKILPSKKTPPPRATKTKKK